MLPNGFAKNGNLRLSVFISPRLESDASYPVLKDFPNLVNWPKTFSGLGFRALINGSPVETKVVGEKPDAGLWGRLFPEDTFVRPFQVEDHSSRFIHSYPAAQVMQFIRTTYGKLAESTDSSRPKVRGSNVNPVIDTLLDTLKRPADPGRMEKEYDRAIKNKTGPGGNPLRYVQTGNPGQYGFKAGAQGVTELAFMQVSRFYSRPENVQPYYRTPAEAHAQGVTPPPRPVLPEVDFHQMVAAVGEYGKMLRRLGLVIDLELKASGIGTTGTVSLSDPWIGGSTPEPYHKDILPGTQYLIRDRDFLPRPKNQDGEYVDGMLRLEGKGLFTIEQIDPDSAALKTLQFANNFNRPKKVAPSSRKYLKYTSYSEAEEEGTPTLRTGGILLLRNERAATLAGRLAAQSPSSASSINNPANTAPILWAEDVIRGFRPDIYDNVSKAWRSLCMRIEHLRLPKAGVAFDDEGEGFVRNTAVTTAHDGSSDDVYLHEALAEWEGWSLAAKRPGKMVEQIKYDESGKPLDRPIIRPTANEPKPVPGFDFAEEMQAMPGSLPRLRFGREYRMRARLADLAGNSMPLEVAKEDHASNPITFFRYEPVSSPVVVPSDVFREGESLDHMVIRSNYNATANAYSTQPYVVEKIKHLDERYRELNDDFGYSYKGFNERHILPPKTSQQMAEMHGEFDKTIGSGEGMQTFFNIAAKEEGTLNDTRVHDMSGGLIDVSPNVRIVTTPDAKRGAEMKKLPLAPGEPLGSGQYLIYTGSDVVLPWLPDPIARGVAFRNLPGATADAALDDGVVTRRIPGSNEFVTLVDFNMHWPVSGPFVLRIEEGNNPPKWVGNTLIVFLPKATKARVQYSCYIGDKDTRLMGVLDMIANDSRKAAAGVKARHGAHWMLTPWRELILAHAVQQPLSEPFFYKPQLHKPGIGSTYADFSRSVIQLNTRSTGKLDLVAEWSEWVDDLTQPGPQQLQRSTHVLEAKIEEWLDMTVNESQEHQENIPLRVKPEEELKSWLHEFGDTHYREVIYRLKGTTRFREYLPISLWRDAVNLPQNDGETDPDELKKRIYRVGPPTTLKVPNSARPDAPSVLYVVPTFGWEETREGNTVISRRCGNALRVYLERPWFSSGDGELLGVIMQQGDFSGYTLATAKDKVYFPLGQDQEKLKPYVTEWGMDPIWKSPYPKSTPTPNDFPLAEKTDGNLSLAELGSGGPLVFVAGHQVEYDPIRRLWFCDIEISAGESYYPFVRLALARYQPESLADAHLSRVVLCDFAQIAPDRVAAATYNSSNNKLKVMVSGIFGTNTYTEYPPMSMTGVDKNEIVNRLALSRIVRVTIEQAEGGGEDELSWEPVSEALTNVQLELVKKEDNHIIWMANVVLPEKPLGHGGTKPMRMNIREYEVFEADPDTYIPPVDIPEEEDVFVHPLEMRGRPSDVIREMLSRPGEVMMPTEGMEGGLPDGGMPEGFGEGMTTYSYTIPGQLLTRLVERIVYADTVEI